METMESMVTLNVFLAWLITVGIKIASCVGIMFVSWLTIHFVQKITSNFYKRQTHQTRLSMTERKAETLNSITNSIMKYVIYFIGICTVLRQLGVSDSSLLVVASAGSVAVGLGAQNIVMDMIEGFFILFEDCYAVGDSVTIQNITGTVEGVTLRSTKIRDAEGNLHIIPNGQLGTITNGTVEYKNSLLEIGVAYEEDIDRVLAVLEDEMSHTTDIEGIIEPPKVVGLVDLADSAMMIRIVTKCRVKTNFKVSVELRRRIKKRFDVEQIEIPFPQTTVHIAKEE